MTPLCGLRTPSCLPALQQLAVWARVAVRGRQSNHHHGSAATESEENRTGNTTGHIVLLDSDMNCGDRTRKRALWAAVIRENRWVSLKLMACLRREHLEIWKLAVRPSGWMNSVKNSLRKWSACHIQGEGLRARRRRAGINGHALPSHGRRAATRADGHIPQLEVLRNVQFDHKSNSRWCISDKRGMGSARRDKNLSVMRRTLRGRWTGWMTCGGRRRRVQGQQH